MKLPITVCVVFAQMSRICNAVAARVCDREFVGYGRGRHDHSNAATEIVGTLALGWTAATSAMSDGDRRKLNRIAHWHAIYFTMAHFAQL